MTPSKRYKAKNPVKPSKTSPVTRSCVIAALWSAKISLRDCEANTGFRTDMARFEIDNILNRLEGNGYDYKTR